MAIFDKFKNKKETKEEKKVPSKKEDTDLVLEKSKAPKRKDSKKNIGDGYGILVKPIIAEKASFLGQQGQYVFEVTSKANKIEIAKAIEGVYGIKPVKVNIIKVRGKNVRYGKTAGRTKSWKKAIVILPKEAKIELYEGV